VAIFLVRHGETEWSKSGKHTGRTDMPLTNKGREQAQALAAMLRSHRFARVLTSPLSRAVETCRLAGFGDIAEIVDDLREWDYGDYEGSTTLEIRAHVPGWSLWKDGVPNGESVEQVAQRADHVLEMVRATPGDVALFSHGHFLRVLAARWLGLDGAAGRYFALDTATISSLGHEREQEVIKNWNIDCSNRFQIPLG
jgi:broad specificity phosphatase PhoE